MTTLPALYFSLPLTTTGRDDHELRRSTIRRSVVVAALLCEHIWCAKPSICDLRELNTMQPAAGPLIGSWATTALWGMTTMQVCGPVVRRLLSLTEEPPDVQLLQRVPG